MHVKTPRGCWGWQAQCIAPPGLLQCFCSNELHVMRTPTIGTRKSIPSWFNCNSLHATFLSLGVRHGANAIRARLSACVGYRPAGVATDMQSAACA